MDDAPNVEALRALREDPAFASLDDFVPPLSLLRAAGVNRDEVAHSKILTELLDPRVHRSAGIFLRTLLMNLLAEPGLDRTTDTAVRKMLKSQWRRVAAHRKLFLIDVVAELTTARGSLVLGIENKIDAAEQQDQLARYQETLARSYPGHTAVMAFLTPQGRRPVTHDPRSPVPVVACGYDLILATIRETAMEAKPDSREKHVLGEFAAHLEEEILGENEVRSLARELWRTHGRALELALEHRPQLGEIRDYYESLLRERFGDDARLNHYPVRGRDVKDIKMTLSSWEEMGFPFEFMLYAYSDGIPHVRALLWRASYTKNAEFLAAWARRVNGAEDGALVDENFTPLRGWGAWCRIFLEDDYPDEAALRGCVRNAQV